MHGSGIQHLRVWLAGDAAGRGRMEISSEPLTASLGDRSRARRPQPVRPFSPTLPDLIADDGQRLPPKAVFGTALTRALRWEVFPKHVTAGIGSPCFRLLNAAGYEIAPKGEPGQRRDEPPADTSELDEWNEGAKKLVSHFSARTEARPSDGQEGSLPGRVRR